MGAGPANQARSGNFPDGFRAPFGVAFVDTFRDTIRIFVDFEEERHDEKDCCCRLCALACLLALPTTARAQSAFAGVVKDTTGAVLPGVTVEAASPVLIEKVRSVTTDANGAYRIENLRPGIYTHHLRPPGLLDRQEGRVELPSNFTSTINADLKVGAIEETVTVSGESPVVDVQSNIKAQVLSRDVLDAVPTAHTIQSSASWSSASR